ncbi:GYD domain-containing protein [Jannaschia ovalis]|uniref:GYD domain-containing protein n=1 Tax=Jannaschia ovalis TaxID=3038773 RepID=A0ABY8LDQ4_9RHOB|nr:GYD domain-containing protein [Jannaschia sp. GRR-S6-38]WGH79451.1 GYD domain-containing protein [Jannaschia sp. GRR-S6-38]
MPFYMLQGQYTAKAIKALVDKPQDRTGPAKKLFDATGVTMHHLFFCFGRDDVMVIVEAPNDEAVAASVLALGASGAFGGMMTTKLLTSAEAQAAMTKAHDAAKAYVPVTA